MKDRHYKYRNNILHFNEYIDKKSIMINIKSYDIFLESLATDLAMQGVEYAHRGQGTFDYLSKTPREFQKVLPENVKMKLRGFDSTQWSVLGPMIDKISFLLSSNGLSWNSYIDTKEIEQSLLYENFMQDRLSKILNRVLDETVFKSLNKSKWEM